MTLVFLIRQNYIGLYFIIAKIYAVEFPNCYKGVESSEDESFFFLFF